MRKNVIITLYLIAITSTIAFAQEKEDPLKEYKQEPQLDEIIIGSINQRIDAGNTYCVYSAYYGRAYRKDKTVWNTKEYSELEILHRLMSEAKIKYGNEYQKFLLRGFKCSKTYQKGTNCPHPTAEEIDNNYHGIFYSDCRDYYYESTVTIVIPDTKQPEKVQKSLSIVIDKAMKNINKGVRLAIDRITVDEEINQEDYTDNLINMLLEKGYKVVAKEYLAKLYAEQQNQQSGVFNNETVVQENNFSAVGYYLNIKVTKVSIRIQVVNVSTGEYEGNATINL